MNELRDLQSNFSSSQDDEVLEILMCEFNDIYFYYKGLKRVEKIAFVILTDSLSSRCEHFNSL